jgi:hypothetical protein
VHENNVRTLSVKLSLSQTSRNAVFLTISCFLFNKVREEGRTCPTQKQGWGEMGEVAQKIYTRISKCKNDKIKERKEKKKN